MREILFRGFHKSVHGKQRIILNGHYYKGNWVQGCYFLAKDKNYNILHYISEIMGENIFKILPETLGQYIGLIDKNGNKIFEGDIVKDITDNELLVVEGNTLWGFDFRHISGEANACSTAYDIGLSDDYTHLTSAVVIGNKYLC